MTRHNQMTSQYFKALLVLLGMGLSFVGYGQEPDEPVSSRVVDLEWEEVEGASAYEIHFVRILREGVTKKPVVFKTTKPSWKGKLNFGQYKMKLRTYDDRDVHGDWTDPMDLVIKMLAPPLVSPINNIKVKTDSGDTYNTKLVWRKAPGASKYRVEVFSDSGDYKETHESETETLDLDLKVAERYSWRVTPIMPNGTAGEVAEKFERFTLIAKQLETPVIDKPVSKFVQKLTWTQPDRTQEFSLALSRKEGKKWVRVIREKNFPGKEMDFDLSQPSGTYKLVLKARSKFTKSSEMAKLIFPVKGGLRNPAAVKQAILKDSIEKPKNFYGIASYLITVMNLNGENMETGNTRPVPNTIGGTGRLGLGYQRPDSVWGGYGIIDLSGFNIGEDNFTFASLELHGTWKKYWGPNMILLSAGVFSKELPDVQDDGNTTGTPQLTGVGKHTNTGPHFGFKFWRPISQKLGIQVNGRMYMNVSGKSPNGEDVVSTTSMQYGALGSYRLTKTMMGFAGYAYRQDNGAYNARFDGQNQFKSNIGDVNTIQVEGHYLNLILEYSF